MFDAPLRFAPIFKPAIWGGTRLRPFLGHPPADGPTGEAWVLSDQGDSVSRVLDGPHAGRSLRDLLADHAPAILGRPHAGPFPLLLKFLDARQPLSVQVHPDDALAKRLDPAGPGVGKTEAWVILDADPDAAIYAGLRPDIDAGNAPRLLTGPDAGGHLHRFTPKPGDCVFLPAGVVHAIGAGVLLFEVQQTSDITYRLSDWGRVDAKTGRPRQLHVEQALACIDYGGPCDPVTPTVISDGPVRRELLVSCRYFSLRRVTADVPFAAAGGRILVLLGGSATVAGLPTRRGEVLLVPAALDSVEVRPAGPATLLEIGWGP